MLLRLHRFLPHTVAEGPGERACLWVQGCPIHCAGCAVPWTWPEDGGRDVEVEDLARRILDGPRVEGVTFLGGEPFAQAEALAELGRRVRAEGMSVMTFTGFVLERIKRSPRRGWLDLLHTTDLLVDGPFRRSETDLTRPWVGSSNQRYHFLTDRYRSLEPRMRDLPNRLEIRVRPDGHVLVNGIARTDALNDLLDTSALHLLPRPEG
ncbi:MAG: 4Fe-4S single cluster domain-containing protein [Chloroflexota bacterium]